MKQSVVIKGPFQPRRASQSLRDQLLAQLRSGRFRSGEPFFSDAHLVRDSGLSRKTVRKALDDLHRDGWIERWPGKGSFVGPRVDMSPIASTHASSSTKRQLIRVAVLVYAMKGNHPDWYSRGVLDGLDETAAEHAVSIELLGSHAGDVKMLTQRLMQSRPDVLAVMASSTRHAYALGEAQRLGIPCLVVGTRLLDLGLPTVCEDGVQGAAMAVRHLVARGHRRIGLLQRPDTAPWVYDRHQGYLNGLIDAGCEPDEGMVLWLSNETDQTNAERLWDFIQRRKPTALLLSSAWHCETLGRLVRTGRLRIPEDLSLITFDQLSPAEFRINLNMQPTIVELPLRQMGVQLAQHARALAQGQAVPQQTRIPCTLTGGESVSPNTSRA